MESLRLRTKVIRRKALLCLLLLLASAVAAGGKGGSSLGASLEQGIERAIELARTQDKLVFLKFGADWCPPCVRMEREAFADPEVRAFLAANTIPIAIEVKNISKPKGVFKDYDVRVLPTLVFLDGGGNMVDRHMGYLSRSDFLERGMLAITRQDAIQRALADLEQSGSDSALKRRELADAYRNLVQYPEALGHYAWCMDEGRKADPAALDDRNALLQGLCELGDLYDPAGKVVKGYLAAAKGRLAAGGDDLGQMLQDASDVLEINVNLERERDTLKFHKSLRKSPDTQRQANALVAVGLSRPLNESRQGRKLEPAQLTDAMRMLTEDRARQRSSADPADISNDTYLFALDLLFSRRGTDLYSVALARGHDKAADLIADYLLAELDSALVASRLAKAGLDSGNPTARHQEWAWHAVDADPHSWQSLVTLARILAERGQVELGKKMLREGLDELYDYLDDRGVRGIEEAVKELASTR